MRKNNVFFFLSFFFLFACNDATDTATGTNNAIEAPRQVQPKTVANIEPRLAQTDRLQFIYYDNPDGDSLRYTRFFTYTETTDSAQIKTLLREINQMYVQEPKARSCRSEGKLFLLQGEDILKTIYFSTRGDSCTYFYFIKDGAFMYFPMTEAAQKTLYKNKRMARK